MSKIVLIANDFTTIVNFRTELVVELLKENKVSIICPYHERFNDLKEKGCNFVDIILKRKSKNPFDDIKYYFTLKKMLKCLKPDIVFTFTIKPNVYGGLAANLLKIPYVSNVTGLGDSIISKNLVSKVSLFLYKIGLKKSQNVFVQNLSIANFLLENRIIKNNNYKIIPGSGVNLIKNYFEPYPEQSFNTRFIIVGRIMKSKGIDELIECIPKVKKKYQNVTFTLVGDFEEDYKKALGELGQKDYLAYVPYQKEMHEYYKNCDAIINASHHEGMSNVLLEAAATGRPIIASRIPGCIETFDEGITGLGFEVKNANSLFEAIIKFIELPYETKKRMGFLAREKMVKEFDRNTIINFYKEEIQIMEE